jgi:exo-beta-1,3-glucanase (GH17 family)
MAYQGQRGGMNPQYSVRDTLSESLLGDILTYYEAHQYPSSSYTEGLEDNPPSPPRHGIRPGMHPESNFNQIHDERRGGNPQQSSYRDTRSQSPPVTRRPVGAPMPQQQPPYREMSPSPPLHPGMPTMQSPNARSPFQDPVNPYSGHSEPQYQQDPYAQQQRSHNYGPPLTGVAALGAAIPLAVRQHSPTAISPPGNMGSYAHLGGYNQPSSEQMDHSFHDSPYRHMNAHESYGSEAPLRHAASPPPVSTPTYPEPMYNSYSDGSSSPNRQSIPYSDGPVVPQSRSHNEVDNLAYVDPNAIIDDGDDGLGMYNVKRSSRINLPFNKSKSSINAVPLAGAGAGAIGGRALTDDMSTGSGRDGNYAPVSSSRAALNDPALEKSVWLKDSKPKGRKWKKTLFILLGILVVLAIAGGAVGGILGTRKSGPPGGQSAAADDANGDLSKDSAEIKKLMNNPNLHKVFSGFAYTPFASQYPECLTNPPSQNNVTRDVAMMSQLTNVLRLYGTDCNQTEMVLHAINRLQLKDMKIWLGVWLGNNDTTNTRQMNQMWKILDSNGDKNLKGIVIGNEVLFRKDLTSTQLTSYLTHAKSNLTAKGLNLPVATSDLGDNWTADLATNVDVVMSNIHPFFGGVSIDQAAGWTYDFWQSHDVAVTAGMTGKKHIISEFGWPSEGGNDCSPAPNCPDSTSGAVANIPNMNKLMNAWVCQALTNGTDYFWYVNPFCRLWVHTNFNFQVRSLRRALEDCIQHPWQRMGRQMGIDGHQPESKERSSDSQLQWQYCAGSMIGFASLRHFVTLFHLMTSAFLCVTLSIVPMEFGVGAGYLSFFMKRHQLRYRRIF